MYFQRTHDLQSFRLRQRRAEQSHAPDAQEAAGGCMAGVVPTSALKLIRKASNAFVPGLELFQPAV